MEKNIPIKFSLNCLQSEASDEQCSLVIEVHSTKVFRERIGFLAHVSQKKLEIYQHKFKTLRTVAIIFQAGMFTFCNQGI